MKPQRAAAALAILLAGCAPRRGDPAASDAGASPPAAAASASTSAPQALALSASAPGTAAIEAPDAGRPFVPIDEPGVLASRDAGALADAGAPAEARNATPRLPRTLGEARRAELQRLADDRSILAHKAAIQAHFGAVVPSPLELQLADLAGDRRAILLSGEVANRNPLLLIVDEKNQVLWTKERPLAGTHGAADMAILAGPEGEAVITWYDAPTRLVGLRRWNAVGTVLADFQLFEVDGCEAISGAYWPGHGWLVVASQPGAARAQLLSEGGRNVWTASGRDLPWPSRGGAPVSIALDTDDTVLLVQLGHPLTGPSRGGPDRALAMRYDAGGAALWADPLEVATIPRLPQSGRYPRLSATRVKPGLVRVTLPPSASRAVADVSSRGAVVTAGKP